MAHRRLGAVGNDLSDSRSGRDLCGSGRVSVRHLFGRCWSAPPLPNLHRYSQLNSGFSHNVTAYLFCCVTTTKVLVIVLLCVSPAFYCIRRVFTTTLENLFQGVGVRNAVWIHCAGTQPRCSPSESSQETSSQAPWAAWISTGVFRSSTPVISPVSPGWTRAQTVPMEMPGVVEAGWGGGRSGCRRRGSRGGRESRRRRGAA